MFLLEVYIIQICIFKKMGRMAPESLWKYSSTQSE